MSTCPRSALVPSLLDDAGDPALERHVGECACCQEALLQAAGALAVPAAPNGEPPPPGFFERLRQAVAAGERLPLGFRPEIPDFEVLEELGRGGVGVVYKARQLSLDRLVALKVRHPAYCSPEAVARGLRAVRALAACAHPGVVQIYQVGRHENLFFGVLEYVPDGSLANHLGRPWPPREAAELVARLADAVAFIHSRGVLHRDIKPGNVLLCSRVSPRREDARVPEGRGYIPKLADFDVARVVCIDDRTPSGFVLGTPGHMAPEQAAGGDVGPEADVWGLGGVLHALLTGRPPDRETARIPGVPPALERVCLACLRPDPRTRYASAAVVATQLRAYLRDAPAGLWAWWPR